MSQGLNDINEFQDAYVKKTIDTLNDLPNVLWIVSEEAPPKSSWWNDHLISFVRAYEQGKGFQHPVGYAALDSAPDSILYNSDADWVAPAGKVSPAKSCGTGKPLCKVNINDSEYQAYAPSGGTFTMDLSAMPNSRKLAVEWFNPASGETISRNQLLLDRLPSRSVRRSPAMPRYS